jgi:hypothetical protein
MGRAQRGWVLAAIVTVRVAQPIQAASEGLEAPVAQLPTVIADAIMMLGWYGDDVPSIVVVDRKPPEATATVEAWVRFSENGRAMPVIYVRTDTDLYRDAVQGRHQALVRLAGILAHERWHIQHGRDEVGAYTAQLAAMEYLHADTMHMAVVRRAMRQVEKQAGK